MRAKYPYIQRVYVDQECHDFIASLPNGQKAPTLRQAILLCKRAAAKKPRVKASQKINAEDAVKITLYIRQDQMFALEDIRRKRIEAGASLGEVDKSKLMREALDGLIESER